MKHGLNTEKAERLKFLARHREAQRKWLAQNLDRAREVARLSRLKHLEKRIQALKKWREEKKKDPAWRKMNSERTSEFLRRKLAADPEYQTKRMETKRRSYHKRMQDPKKRQKTNEQSLRAYYKIKQNPTARNAHNASYNRWVKKRISSDPEFLLRLRLRARLSHMIRLGKIKSTESALHLVGCSLAELKKCMELQFKTGMTWHNHGSV